MGTTEANNTNGNMNMNIKDAIKGYRDSSRALLLSYELTPERIGLVFRLDQAVEVAESIDSRESPFTVEITDENMAQLEDEAEDMGDRFSIRWLEMLGQVSLLMNHPY